MSEINLYILDLKETNSFFLKQDSVLSPLLHHHHALIVYIGATVDGKILGLLLHWWISPFVIVNWQLIKELKQVAEEVFKSFTSIRAEILKCENSEVKKKKNVFRFQR